MCLLVAQTMASELLLGGGGGGGGMEIIPANFFIKKKKGGTIVCLRSLTTIFVLKRGVFMSRLYFLPFAAVVVFFFSLPPKKKKMRRLLSAAPSRHPVSALCVSYPRRFFCFCFLRTPINKIFTTFMLIVSITRADLKRKVGPMGLCN